MTYVVHLVLVSCMFEKKINFYSLKLIRYVSVKQKKNNKTNNKLYYIYFVAIVLAFEVECDGQFDYLA